MALIQNNLGEFIDDFDPYETDRKKIYANCHVDTKYEPSYYEPKEREPRKYKPRKRKEQRAITCPHCGKLFHAEANSRRYCSIKCRDLALYERRRARYKANKEKGCEK